MSEENSTPNSDTTASVDPSPLAAEPDTTDTTDPNDPGDIGTEPGPDPDPTPPPAPVGDQIQWEPATWYSITYACATPGCPNLNIVNSAPMFYSNDGLPQHIKVVDSVCGKNSTILTATKLDPQPIEE